MSLDLPLQTRNPRALAAFDPDKGSAGPPPPPGPRRLRRDSNPIDTGRLVTLIRSVPDRIRLYFRGRTLRQFTWTVIAFGAGYYLGNTITLTFGTLAVNDIVAGAICVALVEFITFQYYTAPKPTLLLTLANSFKIGFTAALITDALKLGG